MSSDSLKKFQKIRRYFIPPYVVGVILSILYLVTPAFPLKTNLYFVLIGLTVLYMRSTGYFEEEQPTYYYEPKQQNVKKSKKKKEAKGEVEDVVIFEDVTFFLQRKSSIPENNCKVLLYPTYFCIFISSGGKQRKRRIRIDYRRIISIKENENKNNSIKVCWMNSEMNQTFECEFDIKRKGQEDDDEESEGEEEDDEEEEDGVSMSHISKLYQMLYFFSFILLNDRERLTCSTMDTFRSLPLSFPDEPKRKIFFLLNSTSGKGKSSTLFYSKIYPRIRMIQGLKTFEVLETKYKGHAYETFSNMDFKEFNEICVCGGDGTFKEVIDGLMNNKHVNDIKTIFTKLLRFSIIPLGSGNGLAIEVLQSEEILKSLLVLSRGRFTGLDIKVLFYSSPIDVNRNYTLPKPSQASQQKEVLRMFESCGTFANLASTADVNHQTELWRWMGPKLKFIVSSVFVMAMNVAYSMDLKFVIPKDEKGVKYAKNKNAKFEWENLFSNNNNYNNISISKEDIKSLTSSTYEEEEEYDDDDDDSDQQKRKKKNVNGSTLIPHISKHLRSDFFQFIINKENEEYIFDKFGIKEESTTEESEEEEDDDDDEENEVKELMNLKVYHLVCSNFKKLTRHLWGPIYNHISDGCFDVQFMPHCGRVAAAVTLNKVFVNKKKSHFEEADVLHGYVPLCTFCSSQKKKKDIVQHFRSKAFLYHPLDDFVRCSVDGEIRVIKKGQVMMGEVIQNLVRITCDEEKVY